MPETEVLQAALDAVINKKALDPVILDTRKLTPFVDYFLICSGQSIVQVQSIAAGLLDELEKKGVKARRKEGGRQSQWVLVDFGWLVAHVMLQMEREFYQIERLWHDAPRVELDASAALEAPVPEG